MQATSGTTSQLTAGPSHRFHRRPPGPGDAMLAQRSGPTPGPKPAPVTDDPDLAETREGTAVGRQSPSPPASPGSSCPWARLAGVDGCLVEPYCLWFQLLARAYWGDVELGVSGPVSCMSWARLRDASRRNCVCSKVTVEL